MERFLFLILLVFPHLALAQGITGRLTGLVTDAGTQEPLVGVNVLVVDTPLGAATDANGRFTIEAVPVGTYRLTFRYIGYEAFTRADVVVRPERTTVVNAGLHETVIEADGLVVEAGYYQSNDTELTSVTTFSTEEIRRSPGAGQEIARVLNALPGVASRGETSQDLFVRGGSPMENGFYIDQILIPNAAHFSTGDGSSYGPTGLINTEFVEHIDFYTGGFSAAYGDRLSSISAIRYREGNTDGYTGEVGLNFSGGVAVFEGPIGEDGSFFISGRRSYLDLIASAINTGGAPNFGDLQGKATYRINARNTLSILDVFGQSRFTQNADDAREAGENEFVDTENTQNTVGLTWKSLWRTKGLSQLAVSHSFRTHDLLSTRVADEARAADQHLRNDYLQMRSVNYYQAGPRLKLEFGGEMLQEWGTFTIEADDFTGVSGDPQPGFAIQQDLDETRLGAFVSVITRPLPRLQATVGLRSDYGSINEAVVLSPRLALSYQLTDRLSLNASTGVFHQGVPLYIVSQNEANRALKPLQSRHAIAGVSYLFTADTRLTIEAYDKTYRDVPEPGPGNDLGDPTYVLDNRGIFAGALVSDGEAHARGIDILLQKKLARQVYGLVSASFFRSRYTDYQGVERDRLFDTRRQFSVIGGYKPNDRWEVSVRWSYSGGRPTTPIDVTASALAGDEIWDVARVNSERLPAYHSLFVRADRRYNYRSANLVTFISIWNAYNRGNVDDRYWNVIDRQVSNRYQFSLLPVGGLELEF